MIYHCRTIRNIGSVVEDRIAEQNEMDVALGHLVATRQECEAIEIPSRARLRGRDS